MLRTAYSALNEATTMSGGRDLSWRAACRLETVRHWKPLHAAGQRSIRVSGLPLRLAPGQLRRRRECGDLGQLPDPDVGIALRGSGVGMAKHGLALTQLGTVSQHVRRVGLAQQMARALPITMPACFIMRFTRSRSLLSRNGSS